MTRPFRFAAQTTPGDGEQWLGTARQAEELGYATLLTPDGLQLLSSMPALALAAGATTTLHVGNFVIASSLRAPRLAAWDAHTISVLTGGRFELGIGAGLPQVAERGVELLLPARCPRPLLHSSPIARIRLLGRMSVQFASM